MNLRLNRSLSVFNNLLLHLLSVGAVSLLTGASACAVTPKNATPIPIAPTLPSTAPAQVEPKVGSGTASAPVIVAPASPLKPGMHAVEKKELANVKALNERYRTATSASMDVTKQVKLGLIGSERKSSGKLYLSKGQLRMELEGAEKTLLVVNKKNLFAVTYPDAQLKGAAISVIKGETTSKKAQSQVLTSLLGSGGFLKSFKPTALQVGDQGELTYFLQPTNNQNEFTRAQMKVSKDGKEIRELRYWDARDNETALIFSNVKFGAKLDAQLFNYTPPADADVMNL